MSEAATNPVAARRPARRSARPLGAGASASRSKPTVSSTPPSRPTPRPPRPDLQRGLPARAARGSAGLRRVPASVSRPGRAARGSSSTFTRPSSRSSGRDAGGQPAERSPVTRCWARSAAAAWASSTGPATRARPARGGEAASRPSTAASRGVRKRFLAEARAAAALDHPHIVKVLRGRRMQPRGRTSSWS